MKRLLFAAAFAAGGFVSIDAHAQVQLVDRPQDNVTEVTGPNNGLSVHDPDRGDATSSDPIMPIDLKHFDFKSKDCDGLEIKNTVGTRAAQECRKAGNGKLEWFIPVELDYICRNTVPASNRRFILHWIPTGRPCTPPDYNAMRSATYSGFGEVVPPLQVSEYKPDDEKKSDAKKTAEELNRTTKGDPQAGGDLLNGPQVETPVLADPSLDAPRPDDATKTAQELGKIVKTVVNDGGVEQPLRRGKKLETKPLKSATHLVQVPKKKARLATVTHIATHHVAAVRHKALVYVDGEPRVAGLNDSAVPAALLAVGLGLAAGGLMGEYGGHMHMRDGMR